MSKKVILLNGPSSSGKSTLSSTLQSLLKSKRNQDYGIVSIDDFLKMTENEIIYEEDVFEVSPKLCKKSIETLDLKEGIIIDHVMTSERIFKQLMDSLKAYNVYCIHVICPLQELERREKKRKNRCLGSAKASYEYLFPKEGYDLSVNTFETSVEECSLQIIAILTGMI